MDGDAGDRAHSDTVPNNISWGTAAAVGIPLGLLCTVLLSSVIIGGPIAAGSLLTGSEDTLTPTATPGDDRDDDGLRNELDDYPDDCDLGQQLESADERLTLQAGEYVTYQFSAENPELIALKYQLTAEGDDGIDVLVLARDEFSEFQNRENPKYASKPSGLRVGSADIGSLLLNGSYVMVLDYSDRGTEPRQDSISVNFEMDAAIHPPSGC